MDHKRASQSQTFFRNEDMNNDSFSLWQPCGFEGLSRTFKSWNAEHMNEFQGGETSCAPALQHARSKKDYINHFPPLKTSDKRCVTRCFLILSVAHLCSSWTHRVQFFLRLTEASLLFEPNNMMSMWGLYKQGDNGFHSADHGEPAQFGEDCGLKRQRAETLAKPLWILQSGRLLIIAVRNGNLLPDFYP